jgi:trafficking protein particle complex subunit 8
LFAGVLVLPSTAAGDATSAFAELFAAAPKPIQEAVREGRAAMHYIFLHDASCVNSSDKAQKARQALSSLPSTVGPSGHVLTLKGKSQERADVARWRHVLHDRWYETARSNGQNTVENSAEIALQLSAEDEASIASAVEELAVRKVAPFVESRIRLLEATALTARRGLRNQLRSLLFRKSSITTGPIASDVSSSQHTASTAVEEQGESHPNRITGSIQTTEQVQLRQLADLALMVGDCETAVTTLRLLASDFKSEKAHLHYAAVQEAMAAAALLSDAPAADVISTFKEAYYRYVQAGQHAKDTHSATMAVRYATRAAMLMAAFLSGIGRYADASWIVMKAHFQEEDMRAAVLLEHAAHLLLRARPPKVRKFAFHLVLAGLRYTKAGNTRLASSAYGMVLEVYRGRGWGLIMEHIREALGRHCFDIGDALAAAQHHAAALASPQLPASRQSLQMERLTEALQLAMADNSGVAPFIDLQVPNLDTSHVTLDSSGQSAFANAEARQVPLETWTALEGSIMPSSFSSEGTPTWLLGGSKKNLANSDAQITQSCCVGEDIGVDISVVNPLRIELTLTRLQLACRFESPSALPGQPGLVSKADNGVHDQDAMRRDFQTKEERITLHPGERTVVHLKVRPLRAGNLYLDGLTWTLNGLAIGQRAFMVKRKGANEIERTEPAQKESCSNAQPSGGLAVKVLPPMPKLEVALHGLPPVLLVGQMVQCRLHLKNAGAMTLNALRAATDAKHLVLESATGKSVVCRHQGSNAITVFDLPGTKLGVNDELDVPLTIRPTQAGPCLLNLCWYYEPLVKLDSLPHRTLCASFTASVLPSLEVEASLSPSSAGPSGGKLLVLRGLNLQGLESFQLNQLTSLSRCWQLRLVDGNDDHSPASSQVVPLSYRLEPQAAIAIHAHVVDVRTSDSTTPGLEHAVQYLASGELSSLRTPSDDVGLHKPINLLLRWHASGTPGTHRAEGFHVIQACTAKASQGVTAWLAASPQRVLHNFVVADRSASACVVDIVLHISNNLSCPLKMRWGTAGLEKDDESTMTHSSNAYFWCGSTSAAISVVEPGQTLQVALQVAVLMPGWVAIEGCWVAWRGDSEHTVGSLAVPACHIEVLSNSDSTT